MCVLGMLVPYKSPALMQDVPYKSPFRNSRSAIQMTLPQNKMCHTNHLFIIEITWLFKSPFFMQDVKKITVLVQVLYKPFYPYERYVIQLQSTFPCARCAIQISLPDTKYAIQIIMENLYSASHLTLCKTYYGYASFKTYRYYISLFKMHKCIPYRDSR